jgi:hypothetical protein
VPEPTPEQTAAGRQIAFRIRAELVCCNIFGRVNDTQELTFKQAKKSPHWHGLCYWAEASARIAETPEQWRDDPADHDWSGLDVVQRRARRQEAGE